MKNKVFGKRVRCYGYLKKQKTKYVVADKKHEIYQEDPFNTLILDGEPIEQETYKIDEEIFDGIVIGTKRLSTRNYYDYAVKNINDYDMTLDDEVVVMKHGIVECYVVAYQMNRKRYVPKGRATPFICYDDGLKCHIIAVDDITKKPDEKTIEAQYKIYKDMLDGRNF